MSDPVYFVHISDSHLESKSDFVFKGANPYQNLEKVIETINALPKQPHFVMHTGDVTNQGHPDAYAHAKTLFAKINAPIYFAVGNHDTPEEVLNLDMGPKMFMPSNGQQLVSYTFSIQSEKFLVLHSHAPFEEIGHHGRLSKKQLDFVRSEVTSGNEKLTVFIHHSPLDLDSKWHHEQVDMVNGIDLHNALLPARDRIRGIFFGHLHRGIQVIKDGLHYCSVGSTFMNLNIWPDDIETNFDTESPPSFNFVALMPSSTIIKEHTVV